MCRSPGRACRRAAGTRRSWVTSGVRPRSGLEGRDRGDVDNVIRDGAAGEIATRSREPLEDRPYRGRPGQPLHELVADVPGVERGEDEDVGRTRHRTPGRLALPHDTD